MKLQDLNIAACVIPAEEDWTGAAARFLKGVTLEQLQEKETWPLLRGVALVRPDSDILPVRTIYEQGETEDQDGGWATFNAQQIGLNVVVSGPPTWCSFADLIASKLLTGRCPEIIRTITLKPVGVQEGLKEFRFFGDPEYTIDLRKQDLFQRFIDMRSEIKRRPDFKGNASFSAMEQGIKLTSSATSYGVLIEFVVEERKKETATTIYHGADATRKKLLMPLCWPTTADRTFQATKLSAPESGLRHGGRSFRQAADCCWRLLNDWRKTER